jgi:hypothetical protein
MSLNPNEVIYVDTGDMRVQCELTHPKYNGMHLLQARVDDCTGRIGVSIVKDTKSATAWMAFDQDHIAYNGPPAIVRSDNGSEFGDTFHSNLVLKGIKHQLIAPGRSRSNGKVERAFGLLWHGLRCIIIDFDILPSKVLPFVQRVVECLNARCRSDGSVSAAEKWFRNVPMNSTDHGFFKLVYDVTPRVMPPSKLFSEGEEVLFDHPNNRFDKGFGKKIDVFPVRHKVVSRLSDVLYILSANGQLRAYDPYQKGAFVSQQSISDGYTMAPIPINGGLLLFSENGYLSFYQRKFTKNACKVNDKIYGKAGVIGSDGTKVAGVSVKTSQG